MIDADTVRAVEALAQWASERLLLLSIAIGGICGAWWGYVDDGVSSVSRRHIQLDQGDHRSRTWDDGSGSGQDWSPECATGSSSIWGYLNPASGLPMIDSTPFDVAGNVFGTDSHDWSGQD